MNRPTSTMCGTRPTAHHETFRSRPHREGHRARSVEITLVVPAFNEEGRLDRGVARLLEAAQRQAVDLDRTEILVVDDASTDRTAERAEQLLAELPHVRVLRLDRHRGKGGSVRAGISQAQGTRVAFIDADMAILPDQLPLLMGALDRHDLAIGARKHEDSNVDVGSLVRELGGRAFNWAVNRLTRVGLADTQCGFKGFHTAVARLLLHCSVTDGFAFDVEVLAAARGLGLSIAELPVTWLRVEGSSIRPLHDPLRMLADVALVRAKVRRPPPVPGLRTTLVPPARAAQVFGDRQPVLDTGHGTLVLLPLVDDAEYRQAEMALTEAVTGQLGAADHGSAESPRPTGPGVERLTLGLAELETLAPLRLVRSA